MAAANAYRDLRRAQHLARLDERAARVPAQDLASQRSAVLELWRSVFG
jgi:glutamate-ammonia-ligase adenylyltransferase